MAEPANLRFLRVLVTVLTATMIGGVLLIVGLMVMRLNQPAMILPETLRLPGGVQATAFTQTADHWLIVTQNGEILVYDRATSALTQSIPLE